MAEVASQTDGHYGDDSSIHTPVQRGRNAKRGLNDTLQVTFDSRKKGLRYESPREESRHETLGIVDELPKKRRKQPNKLKIGKKRVRSPKSLKPTPRNVKVFTPGFTQTNMIAARAEYRILADENPYLDPNYL